MMKLITLNEAAEELNVFYPDLLRLIEHAHLEDMRSALPEDTIPYYYMEELRERFSHYDQLRFDRLSPLGFKVSAALYDHFNSIKNRYERWINEWIQKNYLQYPKILLDYKNGIDRLGLLVPHSFEDFFAVLIAYCGWDPTRSDWHYSRLNTLLSRDIEFNLFKIYSEFRELGKRYDSFEHFGFDSLQNPPTPIITVDKYVHGNKPVSKKKTKQWAFFHGFLEIKKKFNLPVGSSLEKYFEELGRKNDFAGHSVYDNFLQMKTIEGIRKHMALRGGKEYVEMAIELLKKYKKSEAADLAQTEYNRMWIK